MGSFIGHVDEAVFFLLAAVWWMYQMFPRYIQAVKSGGTYKSQLSYGVSCCCCQTKIPVEAILKTLFPFCGLIAELANGVGPHFLDADGNFQKLNGLQHATIYGMFTLHGVIDILTFLKFKVMPPSGDYLTAVVAFLWYGLSFQFHARMPNKEPMETIVHILPTFVIFLLAVIICLMIWRKHVFLLDLVRIYCILVLGTWFIHTSFIMYIPWGGEPNPQWDRSDHRNVHFVVAAFGFHVLANIVVVWLAYVVAYLLTTRRHHLGGGHKVNGSPFNQSHEEEFETLIDSCSS